MVKKCGGAIFLGRRNSDSYQFLDFITISGVNIWGLSWCMIQVVRYSSCPRRCSSIIMELGPILSYHVIITTQTSRAMIALVTSHCRHCSFKSQKNWITMRCVRVKLIKIFLFLSFQGNQEAPAPPEAMAQPYAPAQYPPPPPQNGLPGEYTHPGQDYTGPSPVPEHAAALTIYTPTQTHSEPPGTDSSTPSLTGTSSIQVSTMGFYFF